MLIEIDRFLGTEDDPQGMIAVVSTVQQAQFCHHRFQSTQFYAVVCDILRSGLHEEDFLRLA